MGIRGHDNVHVKEFVDTIRISPPRQYTEEQRQQMGERLRQNRSENTVTQG